MSDDTQNQPLVDESHFPLQNPFLGNINYDQLIKSEILDLIGLKEVDEATRDKLYSTMLQTIENRVLARMADQLTDEELEHATNLTDKSEINDFFESKQINVAKLFAEEAIRYKSEIVSLANRHN